MSAREGANGGGSVREDGLSTVSRDGVITERCLGRRGGAGGNRGEGLIKRVIGSESRRWNTDRKKTRPENGSEFLAGGTNSPSWCSRVPSI